MWTMTSLHQRFHRIQTIVSRIQKASNNKPKNEKNKNHKNIPRKFLEQILLDLRNAGFLFSKKGAGGGYSLNKKPEEIFLVQVMRVTDGPIAMVPCASLNFYHKCDECADEKTCGIRSALSK